MKVVRKKKSTPLGTRMAVASPTGESFALLFFRRRAGRHQGGEGGPLPQQGVLTTLMSKESRPTSQERKQSCAGACLGSLAGTT